MTLRRQLLLVSLLILVLPWAGCQFIRETESALREGQQRMLAGTAQAIADSLSQFPEEMGRFAEDDGRSANQLYGHPLQSEPLVDGYFDDWGLPAGAARSMRGTEGAIRFATGVHRHYLFLFVEVRDGTIVYRRPDEAGSRPQAHDMVTLVSVTDDGDTANFEFEAEAPGDIVVRRAQDANAEPRIRARWQDTATGYQLEARVPLDLLGERLGVVVTNTAAAGMSGVRSPSFDSSVPGLFVMRSPLLQSVASAYVQPGLRLVITDPSGWRLASVGDVRTGRTAAETDTGAGWLRLALKYLLAADSENVLDDPSPSGLEGQSYVVQALKGTAVERRFQSPQTGRAVVAVARPVWSGNVQTGALIMQQGTDAILALANESLARLISLTSIAMLLVAGALFGYSSWLSLRIRRLSNAAVEALESESARPALPSAAASDEIGDLSRNFTHVLQQLGEYNEYLRTLATKLSHELRTPLAVVTSSLENLEHESLSPQAGSYTGRARQGARRLQKILNAMSEANRVEELMKNAESEVFDLVSVLGPTVLSYADTFTERRFVFNALQPSIMIEGSPELLVQMLDKLVDNAVDFSAADQQITIEANKDPEGALVSVTNPGPALPENMRSQLFDSMVSVRQDKAHDHLGLGLHIARLIAEGHGGSISADNTGDGVKFRIRLNKSGSDS